MGLCDKSETKLSLVKGALGALEAGSSESVAPVV